VAAAAGPDAPVIVAICDSGHRRIALLTDLLQKLTQSLTSVMLHTL